MASDLWLNRLDESKESEQPEAVLMMAGDPELMRIVVAWTQTKVHRAKRLTRLSADSEEERWTWLWDNARFERAALLARIPNAGTRTQANFEALIANRVLYPDGTANGFVERYLKERVVKLFSRSLRKGVKGAA